MSSMNRTAATPLRRAALPFLALALVAAASAQTGGAFVLEGPRGELRHVPLDELSIGDPREVGAVLVRTEGVPPRVPEEAEGERLEVVLAGGDRIYGSVAGGDGDRLDLALIGGVVVEVSIDEIRRMVFPARVPDIQRASLEHPEEGDRLYRVTAASTGALDPVDGTIEAFTPEGVRFDSILGSRVFPWSEVAALHVEVFGDGPPADPGQAGVPVVVGLVDQSRLRGALVRLDAGGCRVRVGQSTEVTLPLATLDELALDDGSIAFLSDLAPSSAAAGSPFGDEVGMTWPHAMDRSVTGAPLRAGGREYTRGIGVHAPSRLAWTLDGSWSLLRGSVAVDDQVLRLASRGSVRFRVLVDGEERWASGLVRGGEAPRPLPPIDLEGARELALEVDMATEFHVADRADWLRVLLVRSEALR